MTKNGKKTPLIGEKTPLIGEKMAPEEIVKRSGLYFATKHGNVYSEYFGVPKKLKLRAAKDSYIKFNAYVDGVQFTLKAHRFVWWCLHGSIAKGLHVNHKDFNKQNNRIENLEIVTPLGNARHAQKAGKFKKPKGHAQGIKNGRAKITEEAARYIFMSNERTRTIAQKFGVGYTVIYDIKHKRSWKHLWVK